MTSHGYRLVEQTFDAEMATFERFQLHTLFKTIEKVMSFITPLVSI